MIRRMELADRLRKKMNDLEVSQYALAKKSGVPQPTIHRILIGESSEPRRSTLDKLAKALKTDAEWLATGQGSDISDLSKPPIVNEMEWGSLSAKRREFVERVMMSDMPDSVIDVLQAVMGATEQPQPAPKRPATAISAGPPKQKPAVKKSHTRRKET